MIIKGDARTKALELSRSLVESYNHLRNDWLAKQQWTAVPYLQVGYYFDADRIQRFVEGARALQCTAVLAVPTSEYRHDYECYELPVTMEGAQLFNKECANLLYVLFPPGRAFAVLCNPEFEILAGPKAFVETLLGCGIPQAREAFEIEASEGGGSEIHRAFLRSLFVRYEPFGGLA